MKLLAKVALLILLTTGCDQLSLSKASKKEARIVARVPTSAGNVEAAYAVPVSEFNKAFSQVIQMMELAASGENLDQTTQSVSEERAAALSLLRAIHIKSKLDPAVRSRYATALLETSAIEPLEIADHDPHLSACMKRKALVEAKISEKAFEPTDDPKVNVAICWMMQELLRQILGNYESLALIPLGRETGVDCQGLIKGIGGSPREVSFKLPASEEYLLFFSTSSGLLLQAVDPTLNAFVQVESFKSPKTLHLFRSAFATEIRITLESGGTSEIHQQLGSRRRYWQQLRSTVESISAELEQSTELQAKIEQIDQDAATHEQSVDDLRDRISRIKKQVEQLQSGD